MNETEKQEGQIRRSDSGLDKGSFEKRRKKKTEKKTDCLLTACQTVRSKKTGVFSQPIKPFPYFHVRPGLHVPKDLFHKM